MLYIRYIVLLLIVVVIDVGGVGWFCGRESNLILRHFLWVEVVPSRSKASDGGHVEERGSQHSTGKMEGEMGVIPEE